MRSVAPPVSGERRAVVAIGARGLVGAVERWHFWNLCDKVRRRTRFAIDRDRAVIGRSSDCDVPLDVAAVSRRHAAIVRERDDSSSKTCKAATARFSTTSGSSTARRSRDGDQLVICDQMFRFHGDHDASPSRRAGRRHRALADLVDDDTTEAGRASVMATFDVGGGGSASWRLSAKPEVKLAALLEISNNLGKTLSVEEILPKLLDSLFKIFVQADRGFVVMRPKAGWAAGAGGGQESPRRATKSGCGSAARSSKRR